MNAQRIAAAVASQVAHSKVKAVRNQLFVSFVNVSPVMGATEWANYQELIERTHDSLKAHGAKYVVAHGAAETKVRPFGIVESYSANFEVID